MKEQVKLGSSVKSWRREWNLCLCVPGAGVGKWTDEEVDATLTPAEVAFARRIAGLAYVSLSGGCATWSIHGDEPCPMPGRFADLQV